MDIPSVRTGLRCIGPKTTKLCCQCSSVRWPDNAVKRRWQRLARHVELSGPNPIGKYLGCIHRWGTTSLDGKPVRATEYDMTDVMKSCIMLYAERIEQIMPGSSRFLTPGELPTDSSSGGNARVIKYGDRREYFPDHKAWRRVHDRPRTALITPTGTKWRTSRRRYVTFARYGDVFRFVDRSL